jgi:flagellar motility protein MotE (MotC chaperone)
MKFMKDLFLDMLKAVIAALILSVIAMSLMQKKFPPSYDESRELFQTANKAFAIAAAMKLENPINPPQLNTESLITSREKLFEDVNNLDPSNKDQTVAKEKIRIPTLSGMNRRDLLLMNTKLDQAEYKIRVLEYEIKQLKDEYKKLKSSGVIPAAR